MMASDSKKVIWKFWKAGLFLETTAETVIKIIMH